LVGAILIPNMKVFIRGKHSIDLNQNSFAADGGQGKIYIIGNAAYKIYHDPTHMIPEAKIQELATLSELNIIKPENILLDNKNNKIGYTMRAVPDNYALCQLFPKPFRSRNNLSPNKVIDLVRRMQSTISAIHAKHILIVDLNEMNFLVKKDFAEIYFIDVDSYQTHNFPANALMETVRDRHAPSGHFSEATDWFSFAIVSFQMFRGIHPYKGKHSRYATLDERMIHNVSVLNNEVSYPNGAVLPPDVIPPIYQQWYQAVLEDGKRIPPPDDLIGKIIIITAPQPQIKSFAGHLFDLISLGIFSRENISGDVLNLYRSGNQLLCLTGNSLYNDRTHFQWVTPGSVSVGFTHRKNIPTAAHIDNGRLLINELEYGHEIPCSLSAEQVMDYEGRIYFKQGSNIMELDFIEGSNNPQLFKPTAIIVANVMPQATHLYQGVAIQNILGSYYANIFSEAKKSFQIRLKELDGYKIVTAKYEERVLMIIATMEGKYHRFIFRFDLTHSAYVLRMVTDVTYSGLNFVVLPQGICVSLTEIGDIEIFTNDFKNNNVKVLTDPAITGIFNLMKDGSAVVIHKGDKFYQLKTK
jgi:serine/threonine protein kinase